MADRIESKGSILYHANCIDGLAAAWVTQKRFPDYQAIPVQYGDPVPRQLGDYIWIVDFSYPAEVLHELCTDAKVWVLDHHVTAKTRIGEWTHPNCTLNIDLNQSGAGLAWRHFHPDDKTPKLIRYIEDRDLWRFELPLSKAIHYWLYTEVKSIKDLDMINELFEDSEELKKIMGQAQVLEDYVGKMVSKLSAFPQRVTISGVEGNLVFSQVLQSEIGDLLCNSDTVGIVVTKRQSGYSIHLRSDGTVNVAQIAERFGGGGHQTAAAFSSKVIDFLD